MKFKIAGLLLAATSLFGCMDLTKTLQQQALPDCNNSLVLDTVKNQALQNIDMEGLERVVVEFYDIELTDTNENNEINNICYAVGNVYAAIDQSIPMLRNMIDDGQLAQAFIVSYNVYYKIYFDKDTGKPIVHSKWYEQ